MAWKRRGREEVVAESVNEEKADATTATSSTPGSGSGAAASPSPTRPAPPRRPDASMSLLTETMERPLDPSYAAAAAARRARGVAPRRRPWNTPVVGVVAVLTGVLFATSGLAFARAEEGRTDRADLIARIERRQQEADAAATHNAALEAQLRSLESGAVASGPQGTRLEEVRAAAGATAVEGPGLRITLDDAPGLGPVGGGGPRGDAAEEGGRIVYRDLQQVTNELWASGAEGVAINGHRLTSTTAIRFAGDAVLVGFRPLARPYVIDAIMGRAEQARFTGGAGGRYLDELRTAYSLVADVRAPSSLTLPPADTTQLRYARLPGGGGAPGATSAPSPGTTPEKENG